MSLTQKDLFGVDGVLTCPFVINNTNLVSGVIAEAIACRSYPVLPRDAAAIVAKVTDIYKNQFERLSDDFYFMEFRYLQDLENWLRCYIFPIWEIQNMNLSEAEFSAGIKVDDPRRDTYVFCSAYSPPVDPAHDFVDLDAYIRNLTHRLVLNCVEVNYSSFDKPDFSGFSIGIPDPTQENPPL